MPRNGNGYGQYVRDITLSGGTDSFVAPFTHDFWLYNPPTNLSVTLAKAGKNPQTVSPGEVAVVTIAHGEEVGLTGTAGQILSVYDKFDVKLIPTSKDILGKVQVVDSNGNIVNFPKPASGFAQLTSGNQTTTSTTFVSLGIGISAGITPTTTTPSVVMILTSAMSNNTATDGVQCAIFYNTTGVPVLGTAVGTDTQLAKQQMPTIATANERRSMGVAAIAFLTKGTTYFPYVAFAAITGGTATMVGVGATNLTVFELAVV